MGSGHYKSKVQTLAKRSKNVSATGEQTFGISAIPVPIAKGFLVRSSASWKRNRDTQGKYPDVLMRCRIGKPPLVETAA